jgi:hypothetical protein
MHTRMQQYTIFTRMIVQGNDHFIDDAYRLLVKNKRASETLEKILYDKLLETMIYRVSTKGTNHKRITFLLKCSGLKYLCVP